MSKKTTGYQHFWDTISGVPRENKGKNMFENLWEKIFRRKELQKYRTSADLLEQERGILEETNRLLMSGYVIHLNQQETMMIQWAIEHGPFRKMIEEPKTKAIVRRTWRDLREKIKLHLKADHEPIKDDDETKVEVIK